MQQQTHGKRRFLILLLAGMLACTACEMEDNGMGEARQWTANEAAMLQYAGVEAERIETGKLRQEEKRMLSAMAEAEQFLRERYPAEEISFRMVDHYLGMAKTYTFTCESTAQAGKSFVVQVTLDAYQDGGAEVLESRYHDEVQPQLQTLVVKTAASLGIDVLSRLEAVGLYGAEADPRMPLEEQLASGLLLDVAGQIYVEQHAMTDTLAQQMGEALREKGLCSGVTLLVVKDGCLEEAAKLPLLDNPYVVQKHAVRLPAGIETEVE